VLVRDRSQGFPAPDIDTGIAPVPRELWAEYPWSHFSFRAMHPRGNSQYAYRPTGGYRRVYDNPKVAAASLDRWLGLDTVVIPDRATEFTETPGRAPEGLSAGNRPLRQVGRRHTKAPSNPCLFASTHIKPRTGSHGSTPRDPVRSGACCERLSRNRFHSAPHSTSGSRIGARNRAIRRAPTVNVGNCR
jgi:hypothetical protein